ncbi:hypothetical protein [Yinghuangia soli]|uniref:Uncharacterized protein n=1 Tax=Yinghuangia soli TaxID=2908204 RepID=A0AA41QAA2_9ACTN|nr:hypothetical protein [Yinghuangia soli]MCF2533259.1 hypothetical protein [Yinghuangia soli]
MSAAEAFAAEVRQAFEELRSALAEEGLGFERVAKLRLTMVGHDELSLAVVLAEVARLGDGTTPAYTLRRVAGLAEAHALFEVAVERKDDAVREAYRPLSDLGERCGELPADMAAHPR